MADNGAPVILLSTRYEPSRHGNRQDIILPELYALAVARAGGIPLIVPPCIDNGAWQRLVDLGSGLILTGGPDVSPERYRQKPHPKTVLLDRRRERSDFRLIDLAEQRRLPVLAICLGVQQFVVARGGSLIQHIPDALPDALRHHKRHPGDPMGEHDVTLVRGSRLAGITGPARLKVSTSHHQAVDRPGRDLAVVARADDGVIEAVEDPRTDRFVIGTQWHPEVLHRRKRHLALFEALVCAARAFRR